MICKPRKASLFVKGVRFAGQVVGHGQRWPMPGKLAALNHCEQPYTLSELRLFMAFCSHSFGYARLYAEFPGPLHKMLQVGKFDGHKGSKKKLAWTTEAEDDFFLLCIPAFHLGREAEEAFETLKRALVGKLKVFHINRDKRFVVRSNASDDAVGAVLDQVRGDASNVPFAFRSRGLAEGQRCT